jgi:hypothetical protein
MSEMEREREREEREKREKKKSFEDHTISHTTLEKK